MDPDPLMNVTHLELTFLGRQSYPPTDKMGHEIHRAAAKLCYRSFRSGDGNPRDCNKIQGINSKLIPLLLQRLRRLKNSSEFASASTSFSRPFAYFSSLKSPPYRADTMMKSPPPIIREMEFCLGIKRKLSLENETSPTTTDLMPTVDFRRKRNKLDENHTSVFVGSASPQKGTLSEASNSSWAELETFVIGTVQIFPPTIATRQILILRYLTAMGDYQEFLSHVFEHNALELILCYVNVRVTREARLAFEALKYLAALLCHKNSRLRHPANFQALLEVPRPSIAATGVSICLYYLGYCEEAMERVCLLPKYVVSNLVKYALWLLECSHDSGRCQAIMFFGLTFQFKVILEEFDSQDGLRKLHNVIATLPILLPDSDTGQLNEEQEGAARQIVRHVCVAYRRYLEAHLAMKVELIRRSQLRPNERQVGPLLPSQPSYKVSKSREDKYKYVIINLTLYRVGQQCEGGT
nr:unnamed protein product [Callosobruchus analis]